MVGLLIRMKFAVMRNSITGVRATWMMTGACGGLALAGATIWVAALGSGTTATRMDLLGLAFAMWAFGWMLGPVWGGEPPLRPEHFALEPVPRRRLAPGLLAAGFAGIGTAVTLVAFGALVVFGARLGPAAALVAVPAALLQLTLVVLLSRLTARGFTALSRSRTGGAVTGLVAAAMLVLTQSGWMVLIALDAVLAGGFSREVSLGVRALPSSWGLLAVEAAGRSAWGVAAAALAGLIGILAVLFALWVRALGPRRASRPVVRGSAGRRPRGRTATGAVLVKELRTWWRDPARIQILAAAPAFAVLSCALPVAFDATVLLPFAGALTALMAAVTAANLYGQDGTALWLTLVTPATERADVRGRQLAWLLIFGPMAAALTVAGGAIHGGLWPWALAATIALLGCGPGLMTLVAVGQLVPGPDPHRSKNSPLDHGDVTGQAFTALVMVLTAAAPPLAVVSLNAWAGVAVALPWAAAAYWYFGRLAHRGLTGRGPELLALMRAGRPHDEDEGSDPSSLIGSMPGTRRSVMWTSTVLGLIALFPQAVVPTIMKAADEVARVWFLALYLPERWQWPAIALMYGLALGFFGIAATLLLRWARSRPSSSCGSCA